MRLILSSVALLALAACDPPIPDSAAGVGFDNANLSPRAAAVPAPFTPAVPPAQTVSEETLATLEATRPGSTSAVSPSTNVQNGRVVVEASPSNPQPLQLENAGLSDENDFEAVGDRRSIEEDARRRAAIAGQYQVIAPTDLPQRENSGPNIVEYALQTDNPLGNRIYQRFGINAQARFERNCRAYPSPDQAQIDFLSRGGPEKDRQGLDPDGDGYACAWDPRPFRRARGG
ncbi:hypothetical protein N6L24_10075 [Cognatishimia sp. SS12]|uniref:hypothetical protein n=1 Tax=Cognatishimia sp. SS12 TaxID=2979465 RepID=UPI00232CE970|nr:hypothetical protein [Cognatishimia sp. SS12]MDC0738628.1 hypothetical protein [Cognatishimia sp. SS12]